MTRYTKKALDKRKRWLKDHGYPISKWIIFCETVHRLDLHTYVYEAKKTRSKYIHVKRGDKSFKVRFSDHRPNINKEAINDCDFFVGVTNFNVTNTDNAIDAVRQFFEIPKVIYGRDAKLFIKGEESKGVI